MVLKLSEATKEHQATINKEFQNNEKRYCNASKAAECTSVHVQANQNAQMHHLSLECNSTSTNSTPVFNISNCSTVLSFSK